MSLLSQLLQKKDEKEHFVILCLSDSRIFASIATFKDEKLEFVCKGDAYLESDEKLLEACDAAISKAEENLPSDVLVEKAVFVVPSEYIKEDKIKEDKIETLKKLSSELDLKPAGYVEYPQVITYFIERKEGSPPTFLLLNISGNNLLITFVRIGKIQQNVSVKREGQIPSDFKNALPHLNADILPARIILYGGSENLENVREELMSFPWNKHPSFLHAPKIEIFPPDAILEASVIASETSLLKHIHPPVEKTEEVLPTKEDESLKPTQTTLPDNDTDEISENFGFKHETTSIPTNINPKENQAISEHMTDNISVPEETPFESRPFKGKKIMDIGFSNVKKLLTPIVLISPLPIFFPIILLLLLIGISFAVYTYLPSADVTVMVIPEKITMKKDLILVDSMSDEADTLVVTSVNQEITGEKSSTVTGKTTVGERAKGDITITNKTVASKRFPRGSILTSKGLNFTLDEDVNVASSSETGDGLLFGKAQAKVTASSIGSESNFPKDTSFSFKDFPESSYAAKSSIAFSGGTSTEVSTVSKEDRTRLENTLSDELAKKAREEALMKTEGGYNIIDSLTRKETTEKKFSSETGEQAKDLSLTLSVKITLFSYSNESLISLAENTIQSKQGYKIDAGKTLLKIRDIKTDKNGRRTASAELIAYLIPEIEKVDIAKKISCKTYEAAVEDLSVFGQISGIKIKSITAMPFLNKRLPCNSGNIRILVTSI